MVVNRPESPPRLPHVDQAEDRDRGCPGSPSRFAGALADQREWLALAATGSRAERRPRACGVLNPCSCRDASGRGCDLAPRDRVELGEVGPEQPAPGDVHSFAVAVIGAVVGAGHLLHRPSRGGAEYCTENQTRPCVPRHLPPPGVRRFVRRAVHRRSLVKPHFAERLSISSDTARALIASTGQPLSRGPRFGGGAANRASTAPSRLPGIANGPRRARSGDRQPPERRGRPDRPWRFRIGGSPSLPGRRIRLASADPRLQPQPPDGI